MFGTITDIFMSIIGITILLICFNTLFASVFNTLFAKKLISYVSLVIFCVLVIGGLFFGKQNEEPFYIVFLIFLLFFGSVVLICMIKSFIKSLKEYMELLEIESRCRSCIYFDECDEYFVKDCSYFVDAESDEFQEDL